MTGVQRVLFRSKSGVDKERDVKNLYSHRRSHFVVIQCARNFICVKIIADYVGLCVRGMWNGREMGRAYFIVQGCVLILPR